MKMLLEEEIKADMMRERYVNSQKLELEESARK
jgi:hypothetical protein